MRIAVLFGFLLLSLSGIGVGGCTSAPRPEAKPIPEMSFEHVKALALNVAAVEIENNYHPDFNQNSDLVAFPTPPDIALSRFARQKLRASGTQNILKFIIEEARVSHKLKPDQNDGLWNSWFNDEKSKDEYGVLLKIRLYTLSAEGQQSVHSLLTLQQQISISHAATLAQREWEQFIFLEQMMRNVDQAVTQTLRDKMGLVLH